MISYRYFVINSLYFYQFWILKFSKTVRENNWKNDNLRPLIFKFINTLVLFCSQVSPPPQLNYNTISSFFNKFINASTYLSKISATFPDYQISAGRQTFEKFCHLHNFTSGASTSQSASRQGMKNGQILVRIELCACNKLYCTVINNN